MRKTLQAKYIASEIHAVLFIAMWVLYSVFSQPLADGPSAVLFVILFIVDLPISFVAFGVLLTSAKYGGVAALLWGVLGTLWWYLIGLAIDARIRSHRESRAMEAQQGSDNCKSRDNWHELPPGGIVNRLQHCWAHDYRIARLGMEWGTGAF